MDRARVPRRDHRPVRRLAHVFVVFARDANRHAACPVCARARARALPRRRSRPRRVNRSLLPPPVVGLEDVMPQRERASRCKADLGLEIPHLNHFVTFLSAVAAGWGCSTKGGQGAMQSFHSFARGIGRCGGYPTRIRSSDTPAPIRSSAKPKRGPAASLARRLPGTAERDLIGALQLASIEACPLAGRGPRQGAVYVTLQSGEARARRDWASGGEP
jgi:hypothetical protein